MQTITSFPHTAAIPFSDVPLLHDNDFLDTLARELRAKKRLLAYLALPGEKQEGISLLAILSDDATQTLLPLRSTPIRRMPSLAARFPVIQLFEREIHEQSGLPFSDHPWLKPVRVIPDVHGKKGPRYPYFRTRGREVHEVAVGPVHAGIIEPGHFRFQCYGENVIHLEIALGYQHRGLLSLLEKTPLRHMPALLECAAGDSSIANATAHAVLLERLLQKLPSDPVTHCRILALELERLANHVGDLGAIAGDTGFLPTSSWNGRIRGDILTMTALLTGNRFGRGYVRPFSVSHMPDAPECAELEKRRSLALRDIQGSLSAMLQSASVLERLRGTGILSRDLAEKIGVVGVAAKASGLARDAREFAPLEGTKPLAAVLAEGGDCLARVRVREKEVAVSFGLIEEELGYLTRKDLHAEEGSESAIHPETLPEDTLAVSQVEGFRGEIVHVGLTGKDNTFRLYQVIDPSFHNWPGLALALRENQISDFPLCNKSFNLSYCGHDL